MKKTLLLLFIAISLTAKAQLPATELLNQITFSGLTSEVKADYGTADYPIPSGAFKNIADRPKMQLQMFKLSNSYRWPNGEKVDFSKRYSTANKSGTGMVDVYTLTQQGSKDTIRLYVDPYQEATTYFVPKGLVPLTREVLAKETAPYLKIVEELDQAPDASVLKEQAAQLLQYLSKNIGTAPFIDQEQLKALLNDQEAATDLRSYLMRYYIFGKFYAYAKDLPKPKEYALGKMKTAFEKFIALHPDVKTGNLKELLK